MSKRKLLAVFAVIVANTIWGLDVITIDYMLDLMPSSSLTFLRSLMSFIVLLGIVLIKEGKLHIDKIDMPRVFLCGFIGMSLYTWLEGMGIHRISGPLATLILANVPVLGLMADKIFYKKKMTRTKVMGVVGSVVGVLIIILGGGGGGLAGSLGGVALMFIAAVCWVAYIILIKPLNDKYSLLTLLAGIMASGTVTSIPLFLSGNPKIVLQLSPNVWLILLITSIMCLVFAQFLYVFGVARLSVSNVAVFENILPVVTAISSFAFFGVALTTVQMIGGAIIMVACTAVSISSESPQPLDSKLSDINWGESEKTKSLNSKHKLVEKTANT